MKHSDCKNFTPLDAFKGLCRANGGMVMIDSDTCPQFAAAPNWAYADLNAKTCEGYQAKE